MEQNDPLSDLAHIRSMMERSTRFLSLSGLSGVVAGVLALGGAWLAQHHIAALDGSSTDTLTYGTVREAIVHHDPLLVQLLIDAVGVLSLALLGAFWFTWRRGRRTGETLWNASARRLMINMLIPLMAGGIFCLVLMYYGLPGLVAPTTLLFYGMALLNASKYTLDEIRWLGLSEIALGLIALFWLGAGLMFWALGFGVLHIVYGGVMWMRYERSSSGHA